MNRITAALARRASNAAGTHGDKRTKRLKSRAAKRAQAIKDNANH